MDEEKKHLRKFNILLQTLYRWNSRNFVNVLKGTCSEALHQTGRFTGKD